MRPDARLPMPPEQPIQRGVERRRIGDEVDHDRERYKDGERLDRISDDFSGAGHPESTMRGSFVLARGSGAQPNYNLAAAPSFEGRLGASRRA